MWGVTWCSGELPWCSVGLAWCPVGLVWCPVGLAWCSVELAWCPVGLAWCPVELAWSWRGVAGASLTIRVCALIMIISTRVVMHDTWPRGVVGNCVMHDFKRPARSAPGCPLVINWGGGRKPSVLM